MEIVTLVKQRVLDKNKDSEGHSKLHHKSEETFYRATGQNLHEKLQMIQYMY